MLGRFFALIGVIGMAFTLAGGPALAKGGEKALKLLDTDNDGTVDLAEAKKAATAVFDKFNKDNDKTIDAKELGGRLSKKDLEAANGKAAAATKAAAAVTGRAGGARALEAARAEAQASEQALTQTRAKLQELIGRFSSTTAALAGVETERNQAKQQLASALAQYDHCVERNIGLFDISTDLLDHLEKRDFGAFSPAEALTHLRRTRIANLVDEDRARAAELKLKPRQSAAIPEGPAATESQK